ncbi:hypothetical protein FACS1894187_18680 [Synergistales bacterium]|nr:hypothetical protein FACS1894187_18680 [Synergistales bacterium]
MVSTTQKYCDVKAVAELLDVCRATVYNLQREQALNFPKARKFGRSSRWNLVEVLQWAESTPRGAYGESEAQS